MYHHWKPGIGVSSAGNHMLQHFSNQRLVLAWLYQPLLVDSCGFYYILQLIQKHCSCGYELTVENINKNSRYQTTTPHNVARGNSLDYGVTVASLWLKSLGTWLFIQHLVQINIKNTKALYYWPFVRESYDNALHKGSVMRQMCPCHNTILVSA